MPLTPEMIQSLDSLPQSDKQLAILHLAESLDGSWSGGIAIIANAADFAQTENGLFSCAQRLAAVVPAESQFPPGIDGPAIIGAVSNVVSAATALHGMIPHD